MIHNKKTRKVIAIVGKIGAGKDEAATYLSKKLGWPVFKMSDPLKNELKRQKKEINRKNLADLGTKWSREKGDDYLARLALQSHKGNLIISGPRQLGQIKYLNKKTDLTIVAISADDKIRFERVISRKSVKEASSLQDFIKEELKNDASDGANQVIKCIDQAHCTIDNSSTLKEMYDKLDKILL